MRFETPTEQLHQALAIATRFSERRANLPALAGVLLVAEQGHILLRATNLECGVELTLPAKVTEEGIAAIPAHVLFGFLSNTKSKSVRLISTGETVKVEAERAVATIKTLSADDFPTLPRVPASSSFSAKSSDLVRAIRSVAYCASTSAIKPEQQSILLFAEAGKLSAVATDSFRLAEKTVPLRSKGSVPKLLLPARNALEFVRILEGHNGDIDIYYNENQLSAHVESTYFTSRLVDGSFPNYRQIIPSAFTTEAVVLREDFSQALKALSLFADKSLHVAFSLDPAKKSLVLSASNPDVGEQISTVHASISGEAATMSFNGRYLADSLQAISGESVKIQANGAGKAMLIKDAAEQSYFYMVMPMNR